MNDFTYVFQTTFICRLFARTCFQTVRFTFFLHIGPEVDNVYIKVYNLP